MLDVGGFVDGGVEVAELGVGEELWEGAATGGTGEAEGTTGYFGGLDEGVVVDAVATGGVDEFPDEGFTHIISAKRSAPFLIVLLTSGQFQTAPLYRL